MKLWELILVCFGSARTEFQGYMFSTGKIRAVCPNDIVLFGYEKMNNSI